MSWVSQWQCACLKKRVSQFVGEVVRTSQWVQLLKLSKQAVYHIPILFHKPIQTTIKSPINHLPLPSLSSNPQLFSSPPQPLSHSLSYANFYHELRVFSSLKVTSSFSFPNFNSSQFHPFLGFLSLGLLFQPFLMMSRSMLLVFLFVILIITSQFEWRQQLVPEVDSTVNSQKQQQQISTREEAVKEKVISPLLITLSTNRICTCAYNLLGSKLNQC